MVFSEVNCIWNLLIETKELSGEQLDTICWSYQAFEVNRLHPLKYMLHIPKWNISYLQKYRHESITRIRASFAWKRFVVHCREIRAAMLNPVIEISFGSHLQLPSNSRRNQEKQSSAVGQKEPPGPFFFFQGEVTDQVREKGLDATSSYYKNQIKCRSSQVKNLLKQTIKKCNFV